MVVLEFYPKSPFSFVLTIRLPYPTCLLRETKLEYNDKVANKDTTNEIFTIAQRKGTHNYQSNYKNISTTILKLQLKLTEKVFWNLSTAYTLNSKIKKRTINDYLCETL